jgi:hypothetical protein
MKLLFPIILVATLAVSALSQASIRGGLKVNGVALGAKYADVVKKLGKPTRDVTNRKMDECIAAHIRTLYYPGLKLELSDDGKKAFTLFSFEVTSAAWDVSGAKVGNSQTDIQKFFGTKGRTIQKETAGPLWLYEMTDESPGSSNFFFKAGKVVKIQSGYEMC